MVVCLPDTDHHLGVLTEGSVCSVIVVMLSLITLCSEMCIKVREFEQSLLRTAKGVLRIKLERLARDPHGAS